MGQLDSNVQSPTVRGRQQPRHRLGLEVLVLLRDVAAQVEFESKGLKPVSLLRDSLVLAGHCESGGSNAVQNVSSDPVTATQRSDRFKG